MTSRVDVARLGPGAQRQIAAALYAHQERDRQAAGAKRRKFGNRPRTLDAIRFDSEAEAERYAVLRWRERAGEIDALECHPRFDITLNGVSICAYSADFRYRDRRTGETIIEDVKSPVTAKHPVYRLKKKLTEALHHVTITEILVP